MAHQITQYQRVDNRSVEAIKTPLAEGHPVVFGFSVYDSFESDQVAKDGVVPMPQKGEELLGGHAVLAVGYDDGSKMFIVRNSWGPKWGREGYCMMPYEYLTNTDLADDFWVIQMAEG
jgi:C1A family cysteine protease